MTRILLTLVLPFGLSAQAPQPELLVLVNGERITLQSDTLQMKSSDRLTIFDTLTAPSTEVYLYQLQHQDSTHSCTQIASYEHLKAGAYTFQVCDCISHKTLLEQPLTLLVRPDHTWWYLPAFILYLLLLSGGAVYLITISKVRNASKIYTMRSQWTERLHTNLGGDLLSVSGRVSLALADLQRMKFDVHNNLQIAHTILAEMEPKLRFVFDLIDPTKDSLQTVLNDLERHARVCLTMKDIQLQYQNDLVLTEKWKIDLARIEKLDLIAKECINNIYKHSEATQASILVKRQQKALWIQIADNGKGFDWQAKRKEPHHSTSSSNGGRIGLKSLFSLAKEGLMDLKMQSEPGKGTRVTLVLPEL